MKNQTLCMLTIATVLTAANPVIVTAAGSKSSDLYLSSSAQCYSSDKNSNVKYRKGDVSRLEFKVKDGEEISPDELGKLIKVSPNVVVSDKFIRTYSNNGRNTDASTTTTLKPAETFGGYGKLVQVGFLNAFAPSCQITYDKIKDRVVFTN